jgi:hypothetical protein
MEGKAKAQEMCSKLEITVLFDSYRRHHVQGVHKATRSGRMLYATAAGSMYANARLRENSTLQAGGVGTARSYAVHAHGVCAGGETQSCRSWCTTYEVGAVHAAGLTSKV